MSRHLQRKTLLCAALALALSGAPLHGLSAQALTPPAKSQQVKVKIKVKKAAKPIKRDELDDWWLYWDEEELDYWDLPDVFDDPALAFESVYDALPGSWIESGYFEVNGLDAPAEISVIGGEYSLDDNDYTSTPDVVVNGAWVKLLVLTPDAYGSATTAQLKIGDQVYTFQAINITETDLASLDEMFEDPSGELTLMDGEVELDQDTTAPLVIQDNSPENVLFKLKSGISADVDNGSGTANLLFQPQGDCEMETVAYYTAEGKRSTLLRLMRGNTDVRFDDGDSLLPINDPSTKTQSNGFTALSGGKDTKIEIQSDQRRTKLTGPTEEDVYEAWIKEGNADVKQIGGGTVATRNRFAEVGKLYGGETASFSRKGDLRQIRLGSLKGDQKIAGDPLPLSYLAKDAKVPNLNGSVTRLQGAPLLSAIKTELDKLFGAVGNLTFDETRGIASYTAGGKTYRFVPLGSAVVQMSTPVAKASRNRARLNRFAATNAASTAAGAFNLVAQGIQITLAGSLGYFADLDKAVKSYDAGASIRLQAEGVIRISMGGVDYAVLPASEVTPTAVKNAPAILFSGPSGLAFRDREGGVQNLFAAAGDINAVILAAQKFDPKAAVASQDDGSVLVALLGKSFRLRPDIKLTQPPAGRADENFWQDGNNLYVRYPDGKVQGFGL